MWIAFALLTAIFWGIGYASAENLLHYTDKRTYLFLSALIQLPIYYWLAKPEWYQIYHTIKSPASIWLIICVLASIFGCLFSLYAIEQKNASYAAMVEISYPLFTMLTILVINGRNDFTPWSIFGFIFIVFGIFLLGKG